MIIKYFLNAEELLLDSYRLAKKVLESNFQPNFIVALWRGGTPVGCAVQEFLKYKEVITDHIAIRTSAYEGIDKQSKEIRVHGLEYLERQANSYDRLLIIDDVYDTGLSMKAALDNMAIRMRANMPREIKIAAVYYKPTRNKTDRIPDFYVHETDKWLVFPHELEGLSKDELLMGKGQEIADLLK